MVRDALASLLSLEDDIEVVAELGRGDLVLAAAHAHEVDVALLDIEMPGQDGISTAAELAREHPRTRSLILTTFGRPGYRRCADGQATAAEIAARLHLSEGTVRNYVSTAIRKLGAKNRADAARIAGEKGWLQPPRDRPERGRDVG